MTDFFHVDILIVGAGLSGIAVAGKLAKNMPEKRFMVMESRASAGGTWDLFRYPGVRSDSDMYTFGYSFLPWKEDRAVADGESIRSYIVDAIGACLPTDSVLYECTVRSADWSYTDARWTVDYDSPTDECSRMTCSFLYLCTGYFDYKSGYSPSIEGFENFKGETIHPQKWPASTKYAGKRVVIIGSGATAISMAPTIAENAASVTIIQRSPSYIVSVPGSDSLAQALRRVLPNMLVHRICRWKNILTFNVAYAACVLMPRLSAFGIRLLARAQLRGSYDKHAFTPRYAPFRQRPSLSLDGDIFAQVRGGSVSFITDEIDQITRDGIRGRSGAVVEADMIILATGLNLKMFGDIVLRVEQTQIDWSDRSVYKGMLLSGIPNFAFALGYPQAAWTLKIEFSADYFMRLLRHLSENNATTFVVDKSPFKLEDGVPLIDFDATYVQRTIHQLPKQGRRWPWKLHGNYLADRFRMRRGTLDDGVLKFQGLT